MKKRMLWSGIFLALAALAAWRFRPKAPAAAPVQPMSSYEAQRLAAFKQGPADLGLGELSSGEIYAVIMDWDYGHGLMSLAAWKNGDASMFLENGAFFFGGIGEPGVKEAAQDLISLAQREYPKADKLKKAPEAQPKRGVIRFYFLAPAGIWSGEESLQDLNGGNSKWMRCFSKANDLITQWRKNFQGKIPTAVKKP